MLFVQVGGMKAKILAAYNSDISTVIIPQPNLKNTNTLPKYVRVSSFMLPINAVLSFNSIKNKYHLIIAYNYKMYMQGKKNH